MREKKVWWIVILNSLLKWLARVAAWMSQTVNLFLLFGHHDQTISARCYVNRCQPGWRWAYRIINVIFFWQDDHCASSFEADKKFALDVLSRGPCDE